jgi:hypothetical protein
MSISERRSDNRFLCADLVRVTWEEQVTDAVLEDISAFGACVQVEESIALDSPITLTIGAAVFSGQVSYCVFRDDGYFVGIRFSDETEWSAETVLPQHLTNLSEMGYGGNAYI